MESSAKMRCVRSFNIPPHSQQTCTVQKMIGVLKIRQKRSNNTLMTLFVPFSSLLVGGWSEFYSRKIKREKTHQHKIFRNFCCVKDSNYNFRVIESLYERIQFMSSSTPQFVYKVVKICLIIPLIRVNEIQNSMANTKTNTAVHIATFQQI